MDNCELMWKRWYELCAATRERLVRQYGSSFKAAYALFGAL